VKTFRSNPPWADKILGKQWVAIEKKFGAAFMPLARTEHPKDIADGIKDMVGLIKHHQTELAISERLKQDDSVAHFRDRIREEEKVLAKLRKIAKSKPKGFQEFGCGHYGCVMPTSTPGIVFKVTTDATEAAFIAAYLSWPKHQRPNGIVGYHRLLAIKSESHLKRPVFVLLRDEAQHIGSDAISTWIRTEARENERDYYRASLRKLTDGLGNCLDAGRAIRKYILKKPNAHEILQKAMDRRDDAWEMGAHAVSSRDTALKLAFQLQRFNQNADDLQNEPMGIEIGRAMGECLNDHGLLLADVHTGNIGMPGTPTLLGEIGRTPIITDPGHAITLDDRYKGITVEEV
jgi:hypothetical protein